MPIEHAIDRRRRLAQPRLDDFGAVMGSVACRPIGGEQVFAFAGRFILPLFLVRRLVPRPRYTFSSRNSRSQLEMTRW